MYPKRFRLVTDADGSKVVCCASSTATLGNHLLIAHDLYLAVDAHDVRYRECLVREIIEDVIYRIL